MAISVCAACRESFASLGSFDKHRVGSHAEQTRRCLSVDEMQAAGLTKSKHWHFADTGFNFGSLRKPTPQVIA